MTTLYFPGNFDDSIQSVALNVLRANGYQIWRDAETQTYWAEKAGWDFAAPSLVLLVGLAGIHSHIQPQSGSSGRWWGRERLPELPNSPQPYMPQERLTHETVHAHGLVDVHMSAASHKAILPHMFACPFRLPGDEMLFECRLLLDRVGITLRPGQFAERIPIMFSETVRSEILVGSVLEFWDLGVFATGTMQCLLD